MYFRSNERRNKPQVVPSNGKGVAQHKKVGEGQKYGSSRREIVDVRKGKGRKPAREKGPQDNDVARCRRFYSPACVPNNGHVRISAYCAKYPSTTSVDCFTEEALLESTTSYPETCACELG